MECTSAPQFKKIKSHNGEQIVCLPEDIIEEILSRLPVKSLLKFRCVSKSWRYLIGSKGFMKTHLEKSINSSTLAHHRIIFNIHTGLKQCLLRSMLNEPIIDSYAYDVDDIVDIQWDSIHLVGCCNDLVCILLDRKHFILWNPSTRVSKKLPNLDDRFLKHGHITKYGFGFDVLSNDYKVFGIISVFHVDGYKGTGKVYSLKTDSWRVIEYRDVCPFQDGGMFVSGKLHWETDHGHGCDISSFDLNGMVYGKLEPPGFPNGEFSPKLGVLRGCLSLLCFNRKTHLDIWLMKEYGVKESWVKVVTVPYFDDPRENPFPAPFALGTNGEVLLTNGESFLIYYPEGNVFRHSQIINHTPFRELGIYVEGLGSPVPDVKRGIQQPEGYIKDQRKIL